MPCDFLFHARSKKGHVIVEQNLIDLVDVVESLLDEVFHDDVELTAVGDCKPCFAQQTRRFCHREFQRHCEGEHRWLAGFIVGVRPDLAEQPLVDVGPFVALGIREALFIDQPQQRVGEALICYKETDANGRRTPDSVLANDMYHQLTKEGFKVFFSRITLEDKIGTAYEPYIFAALNSAKVMVVLGTKPEYFKAVWVKNEWSRYLALIRAGADKTLVPAYRDMDPYDLPDEFAHLQAQDMGKLGFMQDLIRGIKKILQRDAPKPVQPTVQQVVTSAGANIENLMKRARLYMEDGDWKSAVEYLDKVLDENAEYAPAYVGKVQASLKLHRVDELASSLTEYEETADWQKAMRFATPEQKTIYDGYVSGAIYTRARYALEMANTPETCDEARALFESIAGFKDTDAQVKACLEKADQIRYTKADERATVLQRLQASGKTAAQWEELAETFNQISWKDAAQRAVKCREKAESIRAQAYGEALQKLESTVIPTDCDSAKQMFIELGQYHDAAKQADRSEEKRARLQAEIDAKQAAETKAAAAEERKTLVIVAIVAMFIIAAGLLCVKVILPNSNYNAAVKAMNSGSYDEAAEIFASLSDYKDSATQVKECQYQKAAALNAAGKYDEAAEIFASLGDYKDSATQVKESQYQKAAALNAAGKYDEAYAVYAVLTGYKDVDSIMENDDNIAAAAWNRGGIVKIGSYDQDGNASNGAEAIEWIVLANDGNTATLISKYGLDAKPYNTNFESVTWETCTLRKWLNQDFLNAAFTAEEQVRLVTVTVTAGKKMNYHLADPGNNTQDKVYLLSTNEANSYFASDTDRVCMPTVSSSAFMGFYGSCMWWLRSPGDDYNAVAAIVSFDGSVDHHGLIVHDVNIAVRPVVVVRLSAGS